MIHLKMKFQNYSFMMIMIHLYLKTNCYKETNNVRNKKYLSYGKNIFQNNRVLTMQTNMREKSEQTLAQSK